MWWSMVVPAKGERPDLASVKLGSWNGAVMGDRVAKKAAKAAGHSYIDARGPGQPRLVKSTEILEGSPDLTNGESVPIRASSVPAKGSSVDLYVDEAIRSMGEFLDAQFANHPDDGSRVIVPTWVGWQSAKAEVAQAAGVMDAAVLDALTAMRATQAGTLEEDRARSHYDAELDRVIGDHDLEDAVKRVHSAFFTSDPLA